VVDATAQTVVTPAHTAQSTPGVPHGRALPPFDRRVWIVAGVVFAVLMVLSPWYGFDRDELYFLDCARHLQASYVDQPVLTPLMARISLSLFGVSLTGLRIWPSLAAAGTIAVGALTARELGGGRCPQLLTAVGVATMPALLGADHLMGPTSIDLLAWAALALFALRVERTGDLRWWAAAGAVLGLGLANKHSIGFFAFALVLGIALSGGLRLLTNRWFLCGVVIAALFTAPDLWWQAGHGWATITMTRHLNADNGGAAKIATWVAGQLLMTSLVLVPVWLLGLRTLWRSRRPVRRGITWAYVLLFVFFATTTGSKIYYVAGAYVPLLAAGIVALDPRLQRRPSGMRRLLVGVGVTTIAALPIVLPVLPASDIGWTYALNQVPSESVGWPELVSTVRHAWDQVPADRRVQAVLVTANYGEAGAINELGHGIGLPIAYGTQNSEWWWGPGTLGRRP